LALKLIEPGKRKGNKYYIILGMEAGRQYEISTRTADKKLAKVRLEDLRAKIDGAPRAGSRITFSQAADLYIEYRSPALQDRRLIEKLRGAMGRMPVPDIRQADLVQVANRLYPQLTAASRNRNVMRPAGSVLHYAARNGYCAWLRIEHFKEPRPVTRAAAPEVGAQLFQATDGAKRLLVTWLFCQGTRISDTLRVRWEHIDLDRRVVALRTRKTDKDRVFPLHDDVLSLLRGISEDARAGRLFPWPHKNNVYRWLTPLVRNLGLEFTPHMARHSLGASLNASGAGLRTIMAALGHDSVQSSMRYQSADTEIVRDAIAKIPRLKTMGK
jgi:integrase